MHEVKTRDMETPGNRLLDEQIAAAFDWWRDAGVDGVLADEAMQWLSREEEDNAGPEQGRLPSPVEPAKPQPPPAAPAFDPGTWPPELEHFAEWWLNDPKLVTGGLHGRIVPRGPKQAALMVLIPQPEAEDSDILLSGPQGRVLSGFLAAAGIAPDSVYLASVLPGHMPMPDWDRIASEGLGQLAAHHVSLVKPDRLLCFGSSILPLLGHDPANSPADFRELNHEGRTVPLMAARDLAALVERPRWRAALWQRWLDWTA